MLHFITRRLQNKLILAFVLVLLIPTTIIGLYAIISETNKLIDVYRTDELGIVEGQANAISLTVSRAKNSLQYLAQSPVTTHFADSMTDGKGDAAYKSEFVAPLFEAFLRNSDTGLYKDVRIMDKSGQEIIRVDNTGGTPTVIADSDLENKADRPYFIEATKLHLTEVYASGLDLNVDKGKIEVPYVPVIRFSTPLYTKGGTFVGVMVVKAFAAAVLAPAVADDPGEHSFLVDSDGTYWLNPDSSKLYGSLVNNNASIKHDQPSDTSTIFSAQNTVLLGSTDRPDLAQAIVHVTLPGEMTSRWTIIHQQPLSNVLSEVGQVRNILLGLSIASLLVAIAAAVFITRGIVRPVVQLSDVARAVSQGNLEIDLPKVSSQDEIGQLTSAFGTMTRDLKISYDNLTRRATELQTVATVSANATTVLDLDQLLLTVSDLTKENFHLYHAHIYLLDEAAENLVLAAGAGEPGRIMKNQGRSIALNNLGSLVARAGRSQQGVIVNDVTQAPDFLPNVLLPDTRAEMAVPMVVADTLIGVLDVQSDTVGRFTESDVQIFATLGNQVAVAVQNARAFSATESAHDLAVTVAQINESLSRGKTELDIVAPIFQVTPRENLNRVSLMHVHTDQNNNPEVIEIAAGITSDGKPLDLSVYPSTRLALNEFPLLHIIIANPDEIMVIHDMYNDPRVDKNMRDWATQAHVASALLMPLKTGDEWHGLVILSYSKPQIFTDKLQEICQQVLPTASSMMATIHAYQLEKAALEESERKALELQTVSEVSIAASTILDVQVLLQTVSDLTKANFDLYHAHIYIKDESGENLVLEAGAGEIGQTMKAKGHSIAVDHAGSLVARVARTRQGVIVNDVTQAADFLPNPLLPATRAEMAVPMIVADALVGVLDVQSDTVGRFTQSDVQVLTTLGAQIAVAVENARLYEVQVETTEELRAVDRLKSEFLASMSHELRTPLNSIIGYSRMLLDSEDEEFSEDAAEDLSAIHNGGRHLLSLINDILDLAKIEANKMELDQESVKLDSVVLEVTQMTSVLFKDKAVSLVVDIPDGMPEIWADRVRLRQVLNNLVSNAVKFTEQGEVRISAAHSFNENELTFSVSDTGIGIPQEKLDAVFERFTQVDGSSARRAGGTGLGLTITRHLIEMHGGRIWAESEVGKGSTFSFTMPLVTELTMASD